jgi:hypothetical protein
MTLEYISKIILIIAFMTYIKINFFFSSQPVVSNYTCIYKDSFFFIIVVLINDILILINKYCKCTTGKIMILQTQ